MSALHAPDLRLPREAAKAVTWSNGFNVSLGIGINLSTSTGFTTEAKEAWKIVSATKLCGSNDYPETGAVTVVGW